MVFQHLFLCILYSVNYLADIDLLDLFTFLLILLVFYVALKNISLIRLRSTSWWEEAGQVCRIGSVVGRALIQMEIRL